mgnify:CR=1 FL=1
MKLSNRVSQLKPSATLRINVIANEMKKKGIDVINLSAGQPDFTTPENIKNAGIEAIKNNFTYYTPSSGITELKKAISKKLEKENNLNYEIDQIIVSCGAKHAVYNACFSLLNEGDEAIIISPYWVSYYSIVNLCGAKPVIINTSLKNNLKLNTVAILYQNDEFGISERDAIKREFEKRGIDIIQEEAYEIGANDVRSQVTKIISKKPDAIIFTGFGSGLVTAIKTVREFNFEGILFSDLNAAYPPLSTDLVNLTEGMYITDFKFDRNDPKIKKFISEFHNEFGNIRVYPNSALEYSAAQIIGQLIKKCGSNINCMKKEVYLSEFDTVLGNVVFDKDGNAIAPVILKQIVNGQEVIVK